MTYLLVGEPAVEPVSVADAKDHLRLDHERDDTLLQGLIRAARGHVEHETGLAMIEQSWRRYLDDWPVNRCVPLARHPVRRVTDVSLYDADGVPHAMPGDWMRLDTVSRPARLLVSDAVPPGAAMNGIEIEFVAGLAETPAEVPDGLRRAVLLLVAHWYEFRGAVSPDRQPVSIPPGFDRLVAPYKAARI